MRALKRQTAPGRPSGRFTQSRRLHKLRALLEGNPAGLLLEDLAGAMQVSTRSVRRYLDELERATEIESVETVPGGPHLWRIKPAERARALPLRRTQAYALLAARPAFEALRGSALHDEVDGLFQLVLQIAQRPGRSHEGDVPPSTRLEDRFLVLREVARSYDAKAEIIDELFRAAAQLRRARVALRAEEHRGRPSKRELVCDPCALVIAGPTIACIARDGRGMRVIHVEHIEHAEVTDDRFELPDGFDARDYVQGIFGVAPPGQAQRVIVEFEARVADEVRARRVHPTQRVASSPDGRVRLMIELPDIEPAIPWVLSFGDAARVIEPPELALHVRSKLDRARAKYK